MSKIPGLDMHANYVRRIDQLKHAQMNGQPAVAELHSPPLEQQSFSAELDASGRNKPK